MTGPTDPDATRPYPGGAGGDPTIPAGPGADPTADRTYVGGPPAGGPPDGPHDEYDEADRRRWWWYAAAALAAGVLVGAIIAILASGGDDKKDEPTTTTSSTTTTSTSTTSTTQPPTTTTTQLQPPGQVENLQAGPGGGSGEVSLQWNGVPGATSYRIYRTDTEGTSGSLISEVNTTSYTDTPGAKRWYRVAAVNAAGEGPKSDEKCGAPIGESC
jgi:hypothetical protein